MNIRRREGHEWAGSVAPHRSVNGTTDILWIESRRSLTWVRGECRRCARAAPSPRGPQPGPHSPCRFRPRRKWRSNRTWRRARRKCAAYLSGRLCKRRPAPDRCRRTTSLCSVREPACASTDIRKCVRDHRLANKLFAVLSKNIRVRRKAVEARSPSGRGAAHANCFPAAGRLMRAGRAGAVGGSDARAYCRPSLSVGAPCCRSEREHGTSLSQRRLVNTNRPRSRDKVFDLHFTHTSARRSRREITHARGASRIASRSAPSWCATFDNFSRKLTCSVAVDKARRVPRGRTAGEDLPLPLFTLRYSTD